MQLLSLYDHLGIRSDATKEQIEKSYKVIAYAHLNDQDQSKMLSINTAYQILRDPYKRSYYDRYGDAQIPVLLNPSTGMLCSRLFTPLNSTLMFVSLLFYVVNFTSLPVICAILDRSAFRFLMFILAPVPLLLVFAVLCFSLQSFEEYTTRIRSLVAVSSNASIDILLLCLYHDGSVSSIYTCILCTFLSEACLLCFFVLNSEGSVKDNKKTFFVLAAKAITVFAFYTDIGLFKIYLPLILASSASIFHMLLGPFLDVLLLFVLVPLNLLAAGRLFWISMLLSVLTALAGVALLLIVVVAFRRNRPITLFDRCHLLLCKPANECAVVIEMPLAGK